MDNGLFQHVRGNARGISRIAGTVVLRQARPVNPNDPPPAAIPVASFRPPTDVEMRQNTSHERGRRLLNQSTLLFAIGALVLFGGCGAGVALNVGILSVASVVVGVIAIILAAVVGTIGRALQGRVL
jgi:hypothetical protein